MLFHTSDEAGNERFDPRQSAPTADPGVWAIDDYRLRNYLVPRQCPRVTYYAGPHTTSADRERFLGSSAAVLAIEQGWLERVRQYRVYCYHLPAQTFVCIDQC